MIFNETVNNSKQETDLDDGYLKDKINFTN